MSSTEVPGEVSTSVSSYFDTILILDFGSQYSHLIARRLREIHVYAELLPCTQKIEALPFKPIGVILSGGPYSVYDDIAPHVDPAVFELGVPVLGICYGMQEIAWLNGRCVEPGIEREYGPATVSMEPEIKTEVFKSFFNSMPKEFEVWMSHGDRLSALPNGYETIGRTKNSPFAVIAHVTKPIIGLQFHPEVTHTPLGLQLIKNFAIEICHAKPNWSMENFVDKEILRIRKMIGPSDHVIGAVSGGVDSTVASKVLKEAIGDRFHAIMVDNGLLRLNEAEIVRETLNKHLGIQLTVVDASEEFIGKLKGVTDPEKKRKIIGNTFIHVFEREAERIVKETNGKVEYLLQGTLYPDVIESISFKGPSQTIKTHHNVGGLLKDMKLKLIEPLRELFKDEVRALGELLGIEHSLVWRHPFPGPGLGIRILGEVNAAQLEIARKADHIFITEIRNHGYYDKISQAFAALLPVKAVGVMGDKRTHEQVIALRAITTSDFMTADWYDGFSIKFLKLVSSRICNEVSGVNRVLYDISSKPPATVEME
ncbi:GMP synthase [glutamine-hydrolyzing] Gua2 [Schizosaccharomyces pombe]|uniref:GMP synthase [glutamine-hydrolyzing] n=1 Tax=Schizosaccharomyces pombe (strain 972 / ATCC 24843) TaxID=284812 RepID=GUAA_SCHPO|nr:putative GMP synthase Gua2 [Schizosaccharomyces pombe]Q9P772.1 RecName: Full=GMP synthase [glutamine-hydrolyzing]; AltName: Full=GMP synthetase; AltName: Full=Glutamine amidotransferase [Schizosaccharomyces pombe 972h-]CAB88269.1 GMP synthase [glutamine-hydrolyzing] Gua2 (predicted) [Schizosaccharomyces pombe]|eukprot:NP_594312.1 putative GMP synthase Gua2 [Schizosaccharomyces pombe]